MNSTQIFSALLSVGNEYGELKMLNLVPTKSHLHAEPALRRIGKNLTAHGNEDPKVFYSDNTKADAGLLGRCFGRSLSSNTNTTTPNIITSLPPLKVPESIKTVYVDTLLGINEACCNLLRIVETSTVDTYTGFDCEWPYNPNPCNFKQVAGKVCVIQMAFKDPINTIFVFHVSIHQVHSFL